MYLIALLLFSNLLFGEYRVYQYLVSSKDNTEQKTYLTRSTLNPEAFYAYHGGRNGIQVELLRSYLCKGNTAKLEYCKDPLEFVSKEESL